MSLLGYIFFCFLSNIFQPNVDFYTEAYILNMPKVEFGDKDRIKHKMTKKICLKFLYFPNLPEKDFINDPNVYFKGKKLYEKMCPMTIEKKRILDETLKNRLIKN
jgi:hypothetical protein